VKPERKELSNIPPLGRALDEGLCDCIGKAPKEDPDLSTRKIVKVLSRVSRPSQTI
jgi:hypothetical protein